MLTEATGRASLFTAEEGSALFVFKWRRRRRAAPNAAVAAAAVAAGFERLLARSLCDDRYLHLGWASLLAGRVTTDDDCSFFALSTAVILIKPFTSSNNFRYM